MHIDSHFPDAVAAFFAGGGRITACQDFAPKPRPARSALVDQETKLVRRKTKPAKPLAVEPDPKPRNPRMRRFPAQPSKITGEAIELVRRYAAEGRSQADAATALGVDAKTVSRAARRHGIKFATVRNFLTDEQIAAAIRPLMEVGAGMEKMRATAKCGRVRLHKVISTFFRCQNEAS